MSRTLHMLLAIGLVAAPMVLLSGAKRSSTMNVTTTVFDYDGAIQLLMRSDDYNGSGFATYTNASTKGKGGTTSVTSQIDADGNWAMYFGNPRFLWLTTSQPVGLPPPPPVPIPTSGFYGGQAHGICRTPNGDPLSFQSLGMGITYPCQLGVEFHYGSPDRVYKLAMGPAMPWAGPDTGVAGVVCNSIASNKCSSWTITSAPDENGQNGNVANLYYWTGSDWSFMGQYSDSFRILVTTP